MNWAFGTFLNGYIRTKAFKFLTSVIPRQLAPLVADPPCANPTSRRDKPICNTPLYLALETIMQFLNPLF